MLKKILITASLLLAASAPAWSQAGQFPSGYVQGNAGAAAGQGSPSAVTAILDRAFGSTRGAIIERGVSGWGLIGPGTLGQALISGGAGADPAYGVLGVVGGGTNCAAASGTCLDNITGFASNGILVRTGGGAYSFISPTRAGDIVYWNGASWISLAGNNSGTQILSENSSGVPAWTAAGNGTLQTLTAGTNISFSSGATCTTTCTVSGPSFANPTGTAGPSANNGVATTMMRSDATPAIQLATNAQQGLMEGDGSTITCAAGVCSTVGSSFNNSLAGNVSLSNTSSYFDGPTVAQGTSGTWLATGNVTITDSGSTAGSCKLWDGTTVIDSSKGQVPAASSGVDIHLSGYLASPAGNLKISCEWSSTTATIAANLSGAGKDSTISVVRIK